MSGLHHPTPAQIINHIADAINDFNDAEIRNGRQPLHALTRQVVMDGIRRANREHNGETNDAH